MSPIFLKLKHTIENNDTKAGRRFDLFIQALIILSLITFSLETLPDLNENTYHVNFNDVGHSYGLSRPRWAFCL